MTDTNMPELTLTPDTAAAAEVPTLTLTPEAPATPAAPEVKKEVEPVVLDDSMLTEQERAAVNEFSKKIDITDTNMVLQYGRLGGGVGLQGQLGHSYIRFRGVQGQLRGHVLSHSAILSFL